jgi:hypothetical protein
LGAAAILPTAARAEPAKLKLAFFGPDTEMTWVTTLNRTRKNPELSAV